MNYKIILVIWLVIGFVHTTTLDIVKAGKLINPGESTGYIIGSLFWSSVKYGIIAICLINGGFFSK